MSIRNAVLMLLIAADFSMATDQVLLLGSEEAGQFDEQVRWTRLESGVRMMTNAPLTLTAPRRLLIVAATPNGNTVEQTLGCSVAPDRDWRFDIQHVAAQVRRLRGMDKSRDLVLAVVQAPRLSWPAFRADVPQAGKIIRDLVVSLAEVCSANGVVLACHSGGGSFIWGYMNEFDAVPASVERIVFLDANYSYSDQERHGDKLLAWLGDDSARRLVIVAYDDREITLNGKNVVGPDGGTYRATERMLARFRRDVELAENQHGPFRQMTGKNGQIELFVHPNPDNKILHTALVGEMNGLLQGLTIGTELEEKWGQFGGPRAYTDWVQAEPFVEPKEPLPEIPADAPEVQLELPKRPKGAPTGSEFMQQIAGLSLDEREAAVVREIQRGNIPEFLRRLKPVALASNDGTENRHEAICFVTPDYMAVGTDEDFFRIPLTPKAAMAIADTLGCTLMTARISDAVQDFADLRFEPRPLSEDRESVGTFYRHHQLIEEQRKGKPTGLLVSGIKKDIVWSNRLAEKSRKVAIYGWHYPEGEPIQPLYVGHWDRYVDYSHGLRLVAGDAIVAGRKLKLLDILKDRELCGLISGEGPVDAVALRRSAEWDR